MLLVLCNSHTLLPLGCPPVCAATDEKLHKGTVSAHILNEVESLFIIPDVLFL